MLRRCAALLLVSAHALLIGLISWRSCADKTELGHMAAAVYFWKTFAFDVFEVNPPLTRIVSGLPVISCHPNYDWGGYSSRPEARCEWALGTGFVTANSPQKTQLCFALARGSLIPLLLLGGYFGFRLAREMFGGPAGFVFLVLWCFSPMLLAWGGTICPDATAAALGIVAVYTFREWLHRPNWKRAAIAGACLGLLPLTKLTWIVAFAFWPLLWCVLVAPLYLTPPSKRSRPLPPLRQLVAMLLLGLYVLNMGYLFDGTFRPLGKYEFISQSFGGRHDSVDSSGRAVGSRFAGTWLGAIPLPLPADFVQGIDVQRLDFERGLPSYLRGQWAEHGWWYYYLYVMLVKMPLGTWGLALLAAGLTVLSCAKSIRIHLAPRDAVYPPERDERPGNRLSPPAPLPVREGSYMAPWRDEILILLPGAALFLLVSSQTGFSKHPRYILPALPFFFVAISRVGVAFTRRARMTSALAAILLAYTVLSSLSIYPHSLSYFNELAAVLPTSADASYPKSYEEHGEHGGLWPTIKDALAAGPRNGPRHLLDSNIDWGQDLYYLEDWYKFHLEARPMKVAYFGGYPLEKTTIESAGYPPNGPDREHIDGDTDANALGPLPGWYALSVNEIYGPSQQYRYFLNFRPVAMAGYSIYIYHITIDEANRVRRELGLKELASSDSKQKAAGNGSKE
jgi:hypothetical protein